MKTIGVLGGMGPRATTSFLSHLADATIRSDDREFPRVIVDYAVHVPSRTRHVLRDDPSPVDAMIDVCRRLFAYPVDRVVVPCNSAEAFLSKVRAKVDERVTGPVAATVRAIEQAGHKKVLVFGGRVTWARGTYKAPLEAVGIKYLAPDLSTQCAIENTITALKRGQTGTPGFIERMVDKAGADAAVLACTEFSLMEPPMVSFIDSNLELAREVATW